ncbi:hypothetical protein [Actinoplanes teichomyceticus]|uniref:Uncharacterized protein n=1 Tax=Actinoplanes teichomyceticus TaxID=1867 RepID=A0A561WAX1_ACTTI|nr:hypothetical protein [Actinoplanes teichomyceticus]TWG21012.1 hypothetical protein FHX34_103541 [Actinoplanes teichomyceticus]GIF14833.1 hypothetical protein Ate01nite_48650 [Actinoplanes teichomyceticus]
MTHNVPEPHRASQISALHDFAHWLAANPDVPLPIDIFGQKQMAHPNFADGISPAEGLTRVRDFAARHGVEVDESKPDRTSAEVRFGIVRYSLLTWHEDGRPGVPDERDAEIERLRAEVAELRAGRSSRCGGDCTLPAGHSGEHAFRDDLGLTYTRADSEPDDPTPVSPGRGGAPAVGAVTDGGLVDETPDEPDEPECSCASTEASFFNCEVHGEPAATFPAEAPANPARVPLHVADAVSDIATNGTREREPELVDVTPTPFDQDAEDAAAFDRGFMAEHRRAMGQAR